MTNPILDQAKAQYAAGLKDPRLQPVLAKLVHAGHQLLFSPHTRALVMKQLAAGHDNPEVLGALVAKVGHTLWAESRKSAPIQALIPAAFILMCDLLQFLEDAGALQVTKPVFAAVAKATGSAALQMMGVTPDKLGALMAQRGASAQPGAPGAQPAPRAPVAPSAAAPSGLVAGAMGGT